MLFTVISDTVSARKHSKAWRVLTTTIMAIPFFSKLREKKSHLKLINKELQKVRDEIAAQTENFDPHVREYMRRVCRGQGKMLRPGLVLLTAAATGGIKPEHVKFAALLEMTHMSSLIHDDVLDKAETRRDQPTPNALWGNELAVLLGDTLMAQAIVMGTEIGGSKFCRKMAIAMRDLCQGEVEQSTRLWDAEMSRADYYELIRKKTATLFAIAMSGAAYLQGMDDEMIEQLNRMGTLLGISYQIYDDCLDLTGTDEDAGKTLGTDAEKGKLTLPVFFLMESSSEDVAEEVRSCVERHEEIDYSRYGVDVSIVLECVVHRSRRCHHESEDVCTHTQWEDDSSDVIYLVHIILFLRG